MSYTLVASESELSGDLPLGVEVPGPDGMSMGLALVRVDDQVFAILDECSHGMVKLSEGDVDPAECAIECYLHGSRFDLRTGRALNLPATEPVPVFPCRIDDGQILVDLEHPISNQE